MRSGRIGGVLALSLLATACGTGPEQRSATGALTGAGIGALAGGPLGLVIGGLAGGAAGAATPIGADQVAFYGMDQTRAAVAGTPVLRDIAREDVGSNRGGAVSGSTSTPPQQQQQQRTASPAVAEGGPETARAATSPVSRDEARRSQTALRAQGFYHGPIDGIVGPETGRALSDYQQQQGLPQTATLDRETRQSLSSDVSPRR